MGKDPKWDAKVWDNYAAGNVHNAQTVQQIYRSTNMDPSLDPHGVKFRESCDSDGSPKSTAFICGLDVTASMNPVLDYVARDGLAVLAKHMFDDQPISDPHIMFAAIGDVSAGSWAPLQVTQFEVNIKIAEQLQKLWLEGKGGGNGSESYSLMWYFAALHTKIDCFLNRKEKGVLFTVGDDGPTPYLTAEEIKQVFGDDVECDMYTAADLLKMVSRAYDVWHISLMEGGSYSEPMAERWDKLLGENHIRLEDKTKLSETIISILKMQRAGMDKKAAMRGWDGSTALVVGKALEKMVPGAKVSNGVVKFK